MVQTGEIDFSRWFIYLVFGLPFLAWLAATRRNALRIAAVVAVLILVQQTFVARRYLWAIGVGPSVIVAYVAFMASAARRRLPRRIGPIMTLWGVLLVSAFLSLVIGSFRPGFLQWNVITFQSYYVEPCLFFFLGALAFGGDNEVEEFLVYLSFIGAIVAITHLFCVATGYRLPNLPDEMALRNQWWSYGGHFTNANTLGHAMALLISTSLVIALDRNAPLHLRLAVVAALVPMVASLSLSGSRGAYLVAALLVLIAVGYSRGTLARAFGVAAITAIVAATAGLVISLVFPEVFQLILGELSDQGLQTPRWTIWSSYLELIVTNPFGVGLDQRNIELVTPEYRLAAPLAHNIYLDLAARVGIIGMLAFTALGAVLLVRSYRALAAARTPLQRRIAQALFFATAAFLLSGVVEPIYHNGFKMLQLFSLLAGASFAASARTLAAERAAPRAETLAAQWRLEIG